MKHKSFYKKRKGLSTIVGGLIFVLLMVAMFSALGVALTSQTDIVDANREVSALDLNKHQEDFAIFNIAQSDVDDLEILISNEGANPTEIQTVIVSHVWDVAGTTPPDVYSIPFSTSLVVPNGDPVDVVATSGITLELPVAPATRNYDIKVISSYGNIQEARVICDSDSCGLTGEGTGSLVVQVLADGPNAVNSKTSTIVMFATNTGDGTITNVTPVNGTNAIEAFGFECDDMWEPSDTNPDPLSFDVDPCTLDSTSPWPEMAPGQTVMFTWDMTILGNIDDVGTFCNGVTADGGITSNTDCDDLIIIDPNDCGLDDCSGEGGTTIILIDDLLIRPSLFTIMPGPFGSSDDLGVWGVNVVNPTEGDMEISKVTLVVYPPTANDNDIVTNNGCTLSGIEPADTNWSCPKENAIMWQDLNNPIPLPSYSSKSFRVAVEPGSLSGTHDIDTLIVQANVLTTFGGFGKAGYQSTMQNTDDVIANVYLTDSIESRNPVNILGQQLGLLEETEAEFKVTLADMDTVGGTYIQAGAKLIINVPRDWTSVTLVSCDGFDDIEDGDCHDDNAPTVTGFGDGSTQIVGTTQGIIGDTENARTIAFKATPPINDIETVSQPYIMYVLGEGKTADNFPVSPKAEIILVVDP